MTVEVFLRKRGARHANEVGLFCESPICEDDFKVIPMDAEVRAELATERNATMVKFAWALATVVADNTEWYVDKDDAMNSVVPPGLKVLARHCKAVVDQETGEMIIKPRSLKRLTNEAMVRLIRNMTWAVTTKLIPGIKEDALRAEVEKMVADRRGPMDGNAQAS